MPSIIGISPATCRAQNPEIPKSLKKASREEFGTPRPRTPKKFRKKVRRVPKKSKSTFFELFGLFFGTFCRGVPNSSLFGISGVLGSVDGGRDPNSKTRLERGAGLLRKGSLERHFVLTFSPLQFQGRSLREAGQMSLGPCKALARNQTQRLFDAFQDEGPKQPSLLSKLEALQHKEESHWGLKNTDLHRVTKTQSVDLPCSNGP